LAQALNRPEMRRFEKSEKLDVSGNSGFTGGFSVILLALVRRAVRFRTVY
jgi:hypothetical protein